MNIIDNSVQRIHLPAGMVLNVRPSTPRAFGTIALASGAVTMREIQTAGPFPATAGPFSVPVDLLVSSRGACSAEVAGIAAADADMARATKEQSAVCLRSGRSLVGWSLSSTTTPAATMAITATDSPFGYPALKVTVPNDSGNVDLIADDLVLANWTAGRANLVTHIYVPDELGIKQVRPYIGNDLSLTRNMDVTYNLSNNNLNRANGHHIVSLTPDNATVNTMLAADGIKRYRLRINGQPGGGVVWMEGLYAPEPVTPWLVITVDDADLTMFTRFHQVLKARGLRGTFAVNWDQVGTNNALYVTQAQLQEMHDYGHDISSHNKADTPYGATTPPTAQPDDAARLVYCAAFGETRNRMRELGWTRGLGYHPFVQGAHDGALVDALKAHGMTIGRGTGPGATEPFRARFQSVLRQRQIGSVSSLSTMLGWIDSARVRCQDVITMGHILANTATGPIVGAQSEFEAVLDYALASGFNVGSMSQWARARGVSI